MLMKKLAGAPANKRETHARVALPAMPACHIRKTPHSNKPGGRSLMPAALSRPKSGGSLSIRRYSALCSAYSMIPSRQIMSPTQSPVFDSVFSSHVGSTNLGRERVRGVSTNPDYLPNFVWPCV